jgi:hypothetical protein
LSFSSWNNGYTKNKCSICPYFKEYGIKSFNCVVLQKYKILDAKHLNVYEQLWINKIKNINKQWEDHIHKRGLRDALSGWRWMSARL